MQVGPANVHAALSALHDKRHNLLLAFRYSPNALSMTARNSTMRPPSYATVRLPIFLVLQTGGTMCHDLGKTPSVPSGEQLRLCDWLPRHEPGQNLFQSNCCYSSSEPEY